MTRRGRRVLIDTTPLYAFLNARDQAHVRAISAFRQLAADRLEPVVPYPALLELHRLLVVRKPSDTAQAHKLLEQVLSAFAFAVPTAGDVEQARATLQRFSDQRLTLADATIAAMALREGAAVLTFDERHFTLMGASFYALGRRVPAGAAGDRAND